MNKSNPSFEEGGSRSETEGVNIPLINTPRHASRDTPLLEGNYLLIVLFLNNFLLYVSNAANTKVDTLNPINEPANTS